MSTEHVAIIFRKTDTEVIPLKMTEDEARRDLQERMHLGEFDSFSLYKKENYERFFGKLLTN